MKRIFGMFMAVLALGLFSCNNEKVDVPDLSEDLALKSAEIAINDLSVEAATTETLYEVEFFSNAEEKISYWWKVGKRFTWNKNLRYRINNFPGVSIEGADGDYPKTITLDYGEGTELKNGKVLSGIIVINMNAPRKSKDYVRTVTYNNFAVDTMVINGTSTVELDKVDDMFRKFNSNLTITFPNETVITRVSERVWQWLAGEDSDENQEDDIVTISGADTATIVWPDNSTATYTKTISEAMKKVATCKYIQNGIVEVRLAGELISVLDYGYTEGDDDCDQYAELKTGDGTEIIDLSERKKKSEQNKNQNQNGNKGQNGNGNGNGNG